MNRKVTSRKVHPISIKASSPSDVRIDSRSSSSHSDMSHHDFARNLDNQMQNFHDNVHGQPPPSGPGFMTINDLDAAGAGEEEGEDDDDDEAITLAHNMPNVAKKQLEDVNKAFQLMKTQMQAFKDKIEDTKEVVKKKDEKIYELEEKVDFQEDEIQQLQQQVNSGNALGGLNFGMLAAAGQKQNKRAGRGGGDALRNELNQSGGEDEFDLGLGT